MSNSPHALAVGAMIEEFRIVRVLGAGSFGIVYECENTYLPETVAIKEFLPPELARRGTDGRVTPLSDEAEETFNWARDRFLQEAKTLWELASPARHPNIVRVTRYCEANGTAYMFMEFERGRPLSQLIEEQGTLSPQELDALFYPVLDGLERVHATAVLHRDIKPANILIRADGSPVLIDFGAARRVVPGAERSMLSAYTPVYAALEQYHEVGDQGPWTDIYGFGATLFQAVTGRKPLSAAERLCGGRQRPVAEECKERYSQSILRAIDRALEIKPEDRPQSVAAWRRCLLDAPLGSEEDEATVVLQSIGPDDPTFVAASPEAETPAASLAPFQLESSIAESPEPGTKIRRVTFVVVLILAVVGIGLHYRNDLFQFLEPQPTKPSPPKPSPPESAPRKPTPPVPAPHKPTPPEPTPPKTRPEPVAVPFTRFSDPLAGGGSGPIMVWLPSGEFQMGSPPDESDRHPDERLHLARVLQPFAIGETEITLGQYRRFVQGTDYKPSAGNGSACLRPDENWQQLVEDWSLSWELPGYEVSDRHPVACVSWNDAQAYSQWLSKKTGNKYRLPTELEWEYAARANTSSSRFWGDDSGAGCKFANTAECRDYTYAAPAGLFPPNAFQLRDMLGNLAEWTCSDYGQGYSGAEAKCSAGTAATPRVFRGGSWLDAPALVRSAARDGAPAGLRLNTVGFRLVRTLKPTAGSDDTGADQVVEKTRGVEPVTQ